MPESHPCPGITDLTLQCHAQLPPSKTDGPSECKYYLHVIYERSASGDSMTCCSTIRAHACAGTVASPDSILCNSCTYSKHLVLKKAARQSVTENRTLTKLSPLSRVSKQKVSQALKLERLEKKKVQKQLEEIRLKLQTESVEVSGNAHSRLTAIMDTEKKDSFTEMFWVEQKKAFGQKSGGMRWHPMMVRFAILVHSQSPSTYRTLREVGAIKLPAESTLRDYTNVLHPQCGYRMEVFQELKDITKPLSENERFVCLMHDEISIKADLVYDRVTGELVGFVDRSKWSDRSAKESHLATHALVFMVVGITANIKMSIGYFPTRTATADDIYPLLWRAIGLLECVCNLKVIASTSDKASPNQRLIRMHGETGYKTPNLFAPGRDLFFFSDVPHLIKTVRNNLSSSGSGKNTKRLWKGGKELLWSHVQGIQEEDAARELRRTKLTAEHVHLSPQSVMRVYLAAQVLSNTVGSVMRDFGGPESQETARFILLMDKFFDCLNTRSLNEGERRRNRYLGPYRQLDDHRFRFLAEDFIGYLEEWRAEVMAREGFTKTEKNKMFLTQQTYEGVKTTVNSMIEATRFMLQSGVQFVLSNRFCQDPLESHFGRHRCMGIRAENPSLWTYGYQENKLRLQRKLALCILPRGNVRSKRAATVVEVDNTPLPKIRRRP